MDKLNIKKTISIPQGSPCTEKEYADFLIESYKRMADAGFYFAPDEDINCLELAHLLPEVPETTLAIYVGINDAVCNKGLVTPLLPRHGHNNVFVFDPQVFSGGDDVPAGTGDCRSILSGFTPPNKTWNEDWTYVMINDPDQTFENLWQQAGFIDMIPAKFEDFTMLTSFATSKLCFFISTKAFDHPVNQSRDYLKGARDKGQKLASEFIIPEAIHDEFDALEPVILEKGEKLYVATTDFSPCLHGWTNGHRDNQQLAVVNENSAVPLDLVIAKPAVDPKYAKGLMPAKGSADMTTDWFYRGQEIMRKPLLAGQFKG